MRELVVIIDKSYELPTNIVEEFPTLCAVGVETLDDENLAKLYQFSKDITWVGGVWISYANAKSVVASYTGKSEGEINEFFGQALENQNFYVITGNNGVEPGLYNFNEVFGAINPSDE